ncbi:telomerase reverse transcriptase-like [Centruroides sculpturatus]|uniref:telomerase reverse transcriptase-like n=1 Tax=Centruroides sculpturatus TaxID=218467 RepID=UPI000C6E51C0|nr:telomerase reverse transcriptase-like [Centruroides sculpturatus]
MTVMDFDSLYPSIKLPPCFCALRDFMLNNIENSEKYRKNILELTELICHTSFFEFNGNIFLQNRGVPMGSPMSPILCDLVLCQLENSLLPEFKEEVILYSRYVDDVFILWKDNINVLAFLNNINNNNYGLKLRLDQEALLMSISLTSTSYAKEVKYALTSTENRA